MTFAKINRGRCGPRKGSLSSADRDRLPPSAFACPKQRKYPLYVISRGEAVPDREHAISAKGRAMQEFHKRRISGCELRGIQNHADKIIALCDRVEGSGAPRRPTGRGPFVVKHYCTDGAVHRKAAATLALARGLAGRTMDTHTDPCAVAIVDADGVMLERWIGDGGVWTKDVERWVGKT